MTSSRSGLLTLLSALACVTGNAAAAAEASPAVEVARTRYGVVHVKARDYAGLGYGFAYMHATDNFCLMARHLVTVNGDQSKYFGSAGDAAGHLNSDFYARYYYAIDASVRDRFKRISPAAKDLIRGYVAGYNRFISATPVAARPIECRDAPWVRPMTLDDMYRMLEEKSVLMSGNKMSAALLAAVPPGQTNALISTVSGARADDDLAYYGSNGWAFGRDASTNGRGLLFGNPHFPWQGDNRFYQLHLTIPGELDVMGATIAPLPVVSIGFNKDVAWTHTVSNAKRLTLFELKLDANDPRRYLVDGKSLPMMPVTVSVDVKAADGQLSARSHVFYETVFGPIVSLPAEGLVWDSSKAYALGDVNRHNVGQIDAWLKMGLARNVREIKDAAAEHVALPWINTLAADRDGNAFYGDISRMPNVSTKLLGSCRPSAAAATLESSKGLFVLDGAHSRCNWTAAPQEEGKALMAVAQLPSIVRTDYVANSNDSYWLVNARFRLSAMSPINGPQAVEQGLRTRIGIIDIERRLAGQDGLDGNKASPDAVRRMLFTNSNFAARLALDDIAKLCAVTPVVTAAGKTVDLTQACTVLAAWDRRDNVSSRGAALFREFWFRAEKIAELYAVAFDPADPIHTPRQLNITNPKVAQNLRTALGEAAALLAENGFALDAPLGELQTVVRHGQKISVSGGEGGLGILNAMRSKPLSPAGYEPVHGTSYLQIVTFDERGPLADAVLVYDQSLDPASPYFSAQTELFSRGELYRLPFTADQIRRDAGYLPVTLPDDAVLHGSNH